MQASNADQQTALQLLRAYLSAKARLINTDSITAFEMWKDPTQGYITLPSDAQKLNTKYESDIGDERTKFERIEYYRLEKEFNKGTIFDGEILFDLVGRGSFFATMLVAAFPLIIDEAARMIPRFWTFDRVPTINWGHSRIYLANRRKLPYICLALFTMSSLFLYYYRLPLPPLFCFLVSCFLAFYIAIIPLQVTAYLAGKDVLERDPAWDTFDKRAARRVFSGAFGFGRPFTTKAHAIDRMQAQIMELERLAIKYETPETVADVHGAARFAGASEAAHFAGGSK